MSYWSYFGPQLGDFDPGGSTLMPRHVWHNGRPEVMIGRFSVTTGIFRELGRGDPTGRVSPWSCWMLLPSASEHGVNLAILLEHGRMVYRSMTIIKAPYIYRVLPYQRPIS